MAPRYNQGELRLPDSLSPARPFGGSARHPALPERFLPPPGFVWGSFVAADGAVLRWGHLPVHGARAACVMVSGFGEFIRAKYPDLKPHLVIAVENAAMDFVTRYRERLFAGIPVVFFTRDATKQRLQNSTGIIEPIDFTGSIELMRAW